MKQKLKAVGIDILGVLMLLGAVLFGWIPGPGGMPLLLGGLALLSINHAWARRLLTTVKNKGSSLYDIFFPDNSWLHWLYDIGGLAIAGIALYIVLQETGNVVQTVAIAALFVGIGLLVTNRRRLEKLTNKIQKLRNKA